MGKASPVLSPESGPSPKGLPESPCLLSVSLSRPLCGSISKCTLSAVTQMSPLKFQPGKLLLPLVPHSLSWKPFGLVLGKLVSSGGGGRGMLLSPCKLSPLTLASALTAPTTTGQP